MVPHEINNPTPGGLLIVGRDPGSDEVKARRPFVGQAGRLLDKALSQAGIRRQDVNIANVVNKQPPQNDFARHTRGDVEEGIEQLAHTVQRLRPNLIVALGNEAAFATIPDWPSRDGTIFGATGITERRGYLWEGGIGGVSCKVLTALHPAACLIYRDPSAINGMLLGADLAVARKEAQNYELRRRTFNNYILASNSGKVSDAIHAIQEARFVACDIECSDAQTLLCIGFATSPTESHVFTGATLAAALEIVADPKVGKVFQNGQFDAYFMATRCGVRVANWQDDCMIAWHALWPEIAGKGKKGSKRTRKSLAFLASLYTQSPEWWKNYEGATDAEMYELNGRDCCITFEIMENLRREIKQQGVEAIYRHEMSMMPVLVAIQERGIGVDDVARQAAIAALEGRSTRINSRIRELAEPLLRERADRITKPHLMFGTRRCACCNGGKSKRQACWSCAGLAKAPGKQAIKATLKPCKECDGVGRFETFDFNPGSTDQLADLLYNVLKLPKRYNDGSLTTDEAALKSLLGSL